MTDALNIEMVSEINNQFSCPDETPEIGGSAVVRPPLSNGWQLGQLNFNVELNDESKTWESLFCH